MSLPPPAAQDPYRNPELFRWAGSMEGVPDWIDPAETLEERLRRSGWRAEGHRLFALTGALLPGVTIAATLALLGSVAAGWLGVQVLGLEKSPVSPILVAILLGLAIRNSVGLPSVYEAGLQLCLKRILRVGVALLGIRLSLAAVGSIGVVSLPIATACIGAALLLVTWVNGRLGLPRRLGTLIAVGTAICGNTAIVATGSVIDADEDEVSYAVGCVTVFGLLALVGYPFLAHLLFAGDARLAGFFLGTAIHDTAQVAGAGLLYLQQYAAPEALETATVTKLVRNLFMIAVIPLMALAYHRSSGQVAATVRPKLSQMVPLFVLGFVAMALLRTLGDLGEAPFGGWLAPESWDRSIASIQTASTWCLTVAMASVGLGTNLKRLRTLGLKPLGVGLTAALVVGAVSFAAIELLRPWI